MRFGLPLLGGAVLLLGALGGCYEIPPRVPEGYVGSPAEPGWPPPAVYDADRFHPANRLFQRLCVFTGQGAGDASFGNGDVPFSLRGDLGAVDRAEVAALLHTLERGGAGSSFPVDPGAQALLASDLLWLSARLEALHAVGTGHPTGEMPAREEAARAGGSIEQSIRLLSRAAQALAVQGAVPEAPLPPPLRESGWTEVEEPLGPGLRPSLADLRWTRVFRGVGKSPSAALVRLRIEVGPDGGPVLLPLGSEAWFLAPGRAGQLAGRVFHFRRTRLIRGEDPWEEVRAEEEIAVIDPRDPAKVPATGKVAALCSGCHRKEVDSRQSTVDSNERPTASGGHNRSAEVQAADARRALEALFSKER